MSLIVVFIVGAVLLACVGAAFLLRAIHAMTDRPVPEADKAYAGLQRWRWLLWPLLPFFLRDARPVIGMLQAQPFARRTAIADDVTDWSLASPVRPSIADALRRIL